MLAYQGIVAARVRPCMSFDVSASSGEDPVPFWGSILTEEERTRRQESKDEATDAFVQACVYYMEQCAENSLYTDMLLNYVAPTRPHAFASLFRPVIPCTYPTLNIFSRNSRLRQVGV